jgi:hypothetical protein
VVVVAAALDKAGRGSEVEVESGRAELSEVSSRLSTLKSSLVFVGTPSFSSAKPVKTVVASPLPVALLLSTGTFPSPTTVTQTSYNSNIYAQDTQVYTAAEQ